MSVFNQIASKGKLTLGLVFPLEAYQGSIPTMQEQEYLAQLAERLGFKSLWFRDVPFNDPNFGDAGQMYDPWIYMTHIMNQTKQIAIGSASIILPLRHPVHVVKSINSFQLLSKNRLILGVASGDRPIEYPAFNQAIEHKSELFRDSFFYIKALQKDFPNYESKYFGKVQGNIDLLPKNKHKTPMLVTGHSGQSLDWIAEYADGWMYYPRDLLSLKRLMSNWNIALESKGQSWKPFLQSLYIDLLDNPNAAPTPMHLGFRSTTKYLIEYLKILENQGVNHVILNLKYSSKPAKEVIEQLGSDVIHHFS